MASSWPNGPVKKRRGTRIPRRQTHIQRSSGRSLVSRYASQHSQVHQSHSQLPVSQQLQQLLQSHVGQLTVWLPSMAGAKGTRPSAAQSKKLFMRKLLLDVEPESIHPRHDV